MRTTFVASEVGNGLRRNLTMTLAVVITVGVSLALFGVSLLVRAQVDTMKDFWYDKVEVSLFSAMRIQIHPPVRTVLSPMPSASRSAPT